MIVVTGTKRSGTSMWMQVLRAGGVKSLGEAFRKNWKDTIVDANKRGFFESRFRRGIYYATNPHPQTGKWLNPRHCQKVGIKIFVPGVIRSDVSYLSRVVASVRPFRQYAASLSRLYALEREEFERKGKADLLSVHMNPVLEWWVENFLLVRDITTRHYPARLVSYEAMLEDPEGICATVFQWLETGSAKDAAKAVHTEDRTQEEEQVSEFSHPFEEVFDEYHHRVKTAVPFDAAFLEKMNETHSAMIPKIQQAMADVLAQNQKVWQLRKERLDRDGKSSQTALPEKDPLNPDRLDRIFHSES